MKAKDFRIKCPECGEILVVDARTGKMIRHYEKGHEKDDDAPDPALFDNALGKVKKDTNEGDSVFDSAVNTVKDRKKGLDDLFKEAKKKADKKGDKMDPKDRPEFWD